MQLRIFFLNSRSKRYRIFFLNALFSIILFYSFNIYSQNKNKDWDANVTFGAGNVAYMNRFQTGILQSSVSLLFRPNDGNNNLEAKFKIMTQSPTREEDGFIEVPLRDYDFSKISELWIRYQIFNQLEFKVGRFPDTPDETTPISWPYYSLYSKIDLYKDNEINPFILFRQDLLSVYSYLSNKSTATNIERTRSELNLNSVMKTDNNELKLNLKSNYDQYSDPDHALSSLCIGREQYIDKTVTNHDQTYRIINFFSDFSFNFVNLINSKIIFKYWKNLNADSLNQGNIYGLEEKFQFNSNFLSIAYYKFVAEQSSTPPSSLSSYYYPGFQISSLDLKLSHSFFESWKALLEYRYQVASPFGQSSDVTINPGTVPVIPQNKIFILMEYNFDSSSL